MRPQGFDYHYSQSLSCGKPSRGVLQCLYDNSTSNNDGAFVVPNYLYSIQVENGKFDSGGSGHVMEYEGFNNRGDPERKRRLQQ